MLLSLFPSLPSLLTLSLSSYLLSALRRRRGCEERSVTRRRADEPTTEGPDCYQRLEFFIQVLRVLCPNLTDASLVVSRVPRLVSVISLFVRASLASPSAHETTVRSGERRKEARNREAGWEGSFIAFATRALHAPPTSHKKSEETE